MDDPRIEIREGLLDNGLKVLVLSDHGAPVVTVQMWYRAGGRDEKQGQRGIAHLFEHMMFRGSEDVAPEGHGSIIESVGGMENAATGDDTTMYHDTVPADRLALAMELEAERMARIRLDEAHFHREREVVKEELRMLNQNNPMMALFERFREVAYTTHPYRISAIGKLDDIDSLTRDDLLAWHRTYYAPNNAVLIVVGDCAFERVMDLAREHFGPVPARPPPPAVTVAEPAQTGMRREELRFPVQLPFVFGGYKIPAASHPDAAALEIVQQILGGGKSARFYRRLIRDQGLAVVASAWNWGMKDPGLFMVLAGFMPEVPPGKVEEALIGQVERLGSEGPTPEELDKAKTQLRAEFVFKLTSISSLGQAIGQAELVEGDHRRFLEAGRAYRRVTAGDVRRVVGAYLDRSRLSLALLLPAGSDERMEHQPGRDQGGGAGELEGWETAARFTNLPQAASRPIELPPIAARTMADGLKVLVVEMHDQPVVFFDLMVPGGSLTDPEGKAGLADVMGTMLTHGTRQRTAEEISLEVERLGGGLAGSTSTEYFGVDARFLAADFERGIELFADAVTGATFPEDELAKVLPQFEGRVRMVRDQPPMLAFETLSYMVYGYAHPRGRPVSIETLRAITPDDLRATYARIFVPHDAILTVVGDVRPEEAFRRIEAALGDWKGDGAQPVQVPPDPPPLAGRSIRLVDKPDLSQATIALGHLGIARKDPDYFELLLGNYVLGGGMASRLFKKVRAQAGKTYTVGSWFFPGRSRGPFGAYTHTRNTACAETLRLVLDTISSVCEKGITNDELLAAKNKMAGSYALRFETPQGVGNQIAMAEFYGLGREWVENYPRLVNGPGLEDVNRALAAHLQPDRLAVVVVGPASELADSIAWFQQPVRVHFLDPVPDEERATGG